MGENAAAYENYWDATEFLSMGQKVPCSFNYAVPGYGFLLRSSEAILPEKHELELPLYLAEPLATKYGLRSTNALFANILSLPWIPIDIPTLTPGSPIDITTLTWIARRYYNIDPWITRPCCT
ncbi:MAG: hypothetical protein SGCHY_003913 [Lobulomycetales sp.]